MYLILLFLGLVSAGFFDKDEEKKEVAKPFGLGIGPTYIGGTDSDAEKSETAVKILKQYVNYKALTDKISDQDLSSFRSSYRLNECEGGPCINHSYCKKTICICDHRNSKYQTYGQCFSKQIERRHLFNGVAVPTDTEKYRKAEPPEVNNACYGPWRDDNGRRQINPLYKDEKMCQLAVMPNVFDPNAQSCESGGHMHCQSKDINMICGPRNLCQCKKHMRFDSRNMECRIFLDVDCSSETSGGDSTIMNLLKGEVLTQTSGSYARDAVKTAFCSLLDSQASQYEKNYSGPIVILGLGIGTFFIICCVVSCVAISCCKCCASVKKKIKSLDPRTHLANMDTNTKLAALGTVVAGEYLSHKEDKDDAARIAAMQQGANPQGYPQGGGYPMPQGQGGYNSVPAGYGTSQLSYGMNPSYPNQGYAPVPTGQQGFVMQPGQGYPQQGGNAPGVYINPEDQGMMGTAMNMAPELAMTGVGLASGNTTMAGFGALAAAEKLDGMEDREDRIRAAVMRGVPPPPMGYAGGPPIIAANQAPQMPSGPPPEANYPRQQMQ